MSIILNILGIIVLLAGLYLASSDKSSVNKKLIGKALLIQFVLAFFLVKFPIGRTIVQVVSDFVTSVLGYGMEGLTFVFGPLADGKSGFIFAISVLGNIVFIGALVGALYYLGIINFIVKVIGGAIQKVLGTSAVESFVAVANMFLGQTESPILVSKYLHLMTTSELMLVLVSGMGSMSATVLMGYVGMGIPMENLLIAGALVPISSIIVSKLLIPETQHEEVVEKVEMDRKGAHTNIMSAISEGATNGMQMAFGIGAALIAITGLVALVNGGLGIVGLSLQQILSYVFAPLALLMGLDPSHVLTAGQLLGSKMVLNEFIAFGDLGQIINTLDPRTALVISISLAGFANISSIGICISGISVFCPERRTEISNIAFRGMIGGFLVSTLSAMIVGLILLF
ncbi:NupC/NupG family nucleoside CNT transporter [Paraclostridium bifermentans]|uniref:NupC/NupG family nucleoside CNT transporter n=1 Tax=Paraclostridium bifermentans TaxID=1490 RepID=UPI00038CA741|nr:nucleoside transporter C-terminal domain-containing protein [Paraclostridium bifermentans]RDC48656.1 NupC/NupG family nucleoside CNT transporter [Acinetobacter sp. RIT592]EQK44444.1 na+ dependent nucleoside transporter family protein [[Clostridium] bifermentans ATCC 19299] [Paraclostridium bifermentans ATCC 19299]MBU5286765.1 NupC/NupG family nucleoside CNT transporter [Paraclostridium bifermentans]MCE9675122.1 NupC/NupG family nucleoside CNT transporter [Paraclostridium bifermentans]MDO720